MKSSGKHGVSRRFVHVQDYARELGTGLPQPRHERIRPAAEAAGAHDDRHGVRGRRRGAHIHMAHKAAARFLVVGGNAVFSHEAHYGRCRSVGKL